MLDFPIVDTHVHLLLNGGIPYRSLQGNYTLDTYNKASESVNVDSIVFMECDCEITHYREEVAFASGLAQVDKRIKGIVASMPVEKGAVIEGEIFELIKNPLVKGVRRLLKFEKNDFCLSEKFIQGVQLLGKYNLSFDLCTAIEQNKNAAKLVKNCSDVSFIVDHIGTPDIKGGRFALWREGMKRLSDLPNVWCKLSSLATEADHEHWTVGDIRPYVEYLFKTFGTDRVLFGGDWPVSLVSASFTRSVALLEDLVSGYSRDEKIKIFRENAIKFYKLK
ncbi:amidohydrolase [Candidatus Atribacteria bacterium HGW-Atribacteria-1]|nr:MAG: amidohydrolase [Candidatus Atribacteria bacterium HGW-Atribacteria-1]